jgi:hypothetical protein
MRDTLRIPNEIKEKKRKIPFKPCYNSLELQEHIENQERAMQERLQKKADVKERKERGSFERIRKAEEKRVAKEKEAERKKEAARLKEMEKSIKDQDKLDKKTQNELKKSQKLHKRNSKGTGKPRGRPPKRRNSSENDHLDDIPLSKIAKTSRNQPTQESNAATRSNQPKSQINILVTATSKDPGTPAMTGLSPKRVEQGHLDSGIPDEVLAGPSGISTYSKRTSTTGKSTTTIMKSELSNPILSIIQQRSESSFPLLNLHNWKYDTIKDMMDDFHSEIESSLDIFKKVRKN